MSRVIARGVFLAAALSVTALAAAAWQEPAPRVLEAADCAVQYCPPAPAVHQNPRALEADGNKLLLLMFGLSHAMKAEQ